MRILAISVFFTVALITIGVFQYDFEDWGFYESCSEIGNYGSRTIHLGGNQFQEIAGNKYLFFSTNEKNGIAIEEVELAYFKTPAVFLVLSSGKRVKVFNDAEQFARYFPSSRWDEALAIWSQMSANVVRHQERDIIQWEVANNAKAI